MSHYVKTEERYTHEHYGSVYVIDGESEPIAYGSDKEQLDTVVKFKRADSRSSLLCVEEVDVFVQHCEEFDE